MGLKDHWYIAAESRELKRKPLAVSLVGSHIALFRTDQEEIAALEDRCSHRNTAFSRGVVSSDCITCPYHGWRFDGAGRCFQFSSLGASPTVPDPGVRSLPVQARVGHICIMPGESLSYT